MEKTETTLNLEVQIKFAIAPAERMTRHYPGSPAHIEDMMIQIEGCDVSGWLGNRIMTKYSDELEEACEDHMRETEAENAMMQAEYRRDAMEDR